VVVVAASDAPVADGGCGKRGESGGEAGGVGEGVDLLGAGGNSAIVVGEETRRYVDEGESAPSSELEERGGLPHSVVEGELQRPITSIGTARSEGANGGVATRRGLEHEVAAGVKDALGVNTAPIAQL
jgi:hypothetical protein